MNSLQHHRGPDDNGVYINESGTFALGNNRLSVGNPVTAEWNNKSGIIFRKKIELDEKFLFRVTQEVQNNSSKRVELYPYAQITRNQDPDVLDLSLIHI